MALTIAPIAGPAITGVLDDLARLRIEVFRDWPYLYDGDMAYERSYLEAYTQSPGALVVGAWHEGRLVGAATGAPMEDHADDFARPFLDRGHDLTDIFYCGESVLLPRFRGQGAGHAFFDHREAQARRLGRRFVCFCAVVRPDSHPARPANYRPLDDFWSARGYARMEGIVAEFAWKDVGEDRETSKDMQFWMRRLG